MEQHEQVIAVLFGAWILMACSSEKDTGVVADRATEAFGKKSQGYTEGESFVALSAGLVTTRQRMVQMHCSIDCHRD